MDEYPIGESTQVFESSEVVTTSTEVPIATPIEVVKVIKTFSIRPYVIVSIIFITLIVIFIILLLVMFFSNSGIFGGNYTRPPPTDPGLIAVNGESRELTVEEKSILKVKVQEALANIAAKQNPPT